MFARRQKTISSDLCALQKIQSTLEGFRLVKGNEMISGRCASPKSTVVSSNQRGLQDKYRDQSGDK